MAQLSLTPSKVQATKVQWGEYCYQILNFVITSIYVIHILRYLVYIDENGDAAGNYTILARHKTIIDGVEQYGLLPVGTFSAPNLQQMPVSL